MGKSAAEILLTTCTDAKPDEKILLVTDDTSAQIADIMWRAAAGFENRAIARMADRSMHGEEPPATVAAAMAAADVIFGITKFSLFHTDARRSAVKAGARFANMADYGVEMMERGGLFADFERQGALMNRVSDLIEGESIRITTEKGTDITASIKGRRTLRQFGRSLVSGASSSPPNIETALGPVEGTAEGVAVIDGSIPFPGLGVLGEDIRLTIKGGRIVGIDGGAQARTLEAGLAALRDDAAYQMAEIGIGFNDCSTLSNRMLEDEGVMGTAHFGFGGNVSFGGVIESSVHIDMVFKAPSIWVDGRQVMDRGDMLVE